MFSKTVNSEYINTFRNRKMLWHESLKYTEKHKSLLLEVGQPAESVRCP